MKVDSIKAAVAKSMRRPVSLKLTDGRTLSIPHPEFATFSNRSNATEFLVSLPSGGIEVVSIDEIASIERGLPIKKTIKS